MIAASFSAFGGPEALEVIDLPAPEPGAGEARVRVAAATINPTDILMLAGKQVAAMQGLEPPFIAGMEFAGHVETPGPDGRFAVGDAVMGAINPRRPARGAMAELVTVAEVSLMPVPAGMDLAEAATIPMNGMTAVMSLDLLDLAPGATVLVTGAPGALGGYFVQLAADAGLTVIADGRPADEELMRGLGAVHFVARGDGMADAVRAICPDGVDGLLDAALLGEAAAALVRDSGAAVAVRSSNPIESGRIRAATVAVPKGMEDPALVARLADAAGRGVLTPRIAARFPARDAAAAFGMVEKGGQRGRVVLTFND